MNISKFTQNSVQAIEQCEKLAYEYGNQEIEQEHLLYSLLTLEDSLILKLIVKMEIDKEHFLDRVKKAVEKRVKVQGGQKLIGEHLNKVLISAEDEAKQMGDEYVSVEHLFLSMLKYPNKEIKEIFREYGEITTFVCRLIPGIRQLISLPAGLAQMKHGSFILFTVLGAGIWNLILTGIGVYLGHLSKDLTYVELVHKGKQMISDHFVWILLFLVIVVAGYLLIHKKVMKKKAV